MAIGDKEKGSQYLLEVMETIKRQDEQETGPKWLDFWKNEVAWIYKAWIILKVVTFIPHRNEVAFIYKAWIILKVVTFIPHRNEVR